MKKVLVIEKDVVNARRMGTVWREAGFQVRLTQDLREAALETVLWGPDLIVLDLEGVESEGKEFLQQLQKDPQSSKIPVVLVSPSDRGRMSDVVLQSVRLILDRPFRFETMLGGVGDRPSARLEKRSGAPIAG